MCQHFSSREKEIDLVAGRKDQLIEFGIAAQRIKILIPLSADSQCWLEIQGAPQRLKRGVDRS